MIETFDATQQNILLQSGLTLLFQILFGVCAEITVYALQRLSIRYDWMPGEVFFTAISWQAIFWFTASAIYDTLPIFLPPALAGLSGMAIQFVAPVAFVIVIVRLCTGWITAYLRRNGIASVSLINNTVRFLGVLAIIGTILALMGVPLGPLLTIMAGSSLGFTLALREPLANFFSGMVVLASNKIRPGDYIRLDSGEEGYVTDIRWSDTYVRQLANNVIVIPNSRMMNTVVTNFTRPESELSILVDVGVGYEADLTVVEALVHQVAGEVLGEIEGGVGEFDPLIRYNRFNEWGINFTVVLRGKEFVNQFLIKHEFVKRLHQQFVSAGVPLPRAKRAIEVHNLPSALHELNPIGTASLPHNTSD